MNLTKGQIMLINNMVNTELSNKNTVYNPTELVNLKEQLILSGVVVAKGTLPLDEFIKGVENYEYGQKNHTIKRTPERMRTILAATHWCKKIAENLAK